MSLTAPNPIIKPFCNTGTQVAPPVGADSLVANQETGFPDSQATPLPIGTEVQQNEMNGVLRLYTSLLLWLNSGGQFTFNQAFSDANNGYALDNILWCASNSTFQRSLVANNTANFVTTPSYINDGINWIDVNNASFPDIQNNPTTGDVTIGGRIANSVNNIKTLGDDGKLSGMVTGNEGSILYVTEPDGETINTAVVNQYGYRPFHNGTATAILDPANTFAYVSELPIVNNNIRVKKLNISEFSILYLQAVYDGAKWGCSIIGEMGLSDSLSPNQFFWENNIDLALFGISNITPGEGMASVRRINTAATPILCKSFVNNSGPIGPLREYLFVQIEFSPPSNQLTGVNAGFAINFTATSVS
jgi:hypothetical protein